MNIIILSSRHFVLKFICQCNLLIHLSMADLAASAREQSDRAHKWLLPILGGVRPYAGVCMHAKCKQITFWLRSLSCVACVYASSIDRHSDATFIKCNNHKNWYPIERRAPGYCRHHRFESDICIGMQYCKRNYIYGCSDLDACIIFIHRMASVAHWLRQRAKSAPTKETQENLKWEQQLMMKLENSLQIYRWSGSTWPTILYILLLLTL